MLKFVFEKGKYLMSSKLAKLFVARNVVGLCRVFYVKNFYVGS